MPEIYRLKVTLLGSRPPIWRRLVVPGNLDFERLHLVIQDAMGWWNEHLHSFEVGGRPVQAERQYTIDRVGRDGRFTYVYDLGDSWTHEIAVEDVTSGELDAPRCVAGERACPPEHCGGVWSYAELIDVLADRTHARHEELAGLLPDGWWPERFDLETADRLVARHRPVIRLRARARA